MPACSATVALSAAQLYLVDAPAGLAASALKCGPLSNCLIAPHVGQVCLRLPARFSAVQFADARLRSSIVALGAAQLYLVDAPAGLAASALTGNCGPLSNCLIAPRVGQVCLLHGLQGTAALPTYCSVLKRVCASI